MADLTVLRVGTYCSIGSFSEGFLNIQGKGHKKKLGKNSDSIYQFLHLQWGTNPQWTFWEALQQGSFWQNFVVPTSTYTVWNTSSTDGSKKLFSGIVFDQIFVVPMSMYMVWNTSSTDVSDKWFLRDESDKTFAVPASMYAVSRSESSTDTLAKEVWRDLPAAKLMLPGRIAQRVTSK